MSVFLYRVKELRGGGGGAPVGDIPHQQGQLDLPPLDEVESGGVADVGSPPHMQADLQYLHRSLHKVGSESSMEF